MVNIFETADKLRKQLLVNWLRYAVLGGVVGFILSPILRLLVPSFADKPWHYVPIFAFISGYLMVLLLGTLYVFLVATIRMLASQIRLINARFTGSPDDSGWMAISTPGVLALSLVVSLFANTWGWLMLLATDPLYIDHGGMTWVGFLTWLAMSCFAEKPIRSLVERVQSYLDDMYDRGHAEYVESRKLLKSRGH